MRLLIVTNALAKGGAEKLIEVTAPLFQLRGVDVTILLLNQSESVSEYIESIQKSDIKIIDLKAKSYYDLRNIIKIKKQITLQDYDIIHTHLFPSLYWVSLACKFSRIPKLKLVYTEHSNQNKRRNTPYFKRIDRYIYRSFHRIVAITQDVKDNLSRWIGRSQNIEVIENGVNLNVIQKALIVDRNTFIDTLNIPDRAVLLLMTASFRYPKDQSTLVRAIHLLTDNVVLLFAGEGESLQHIKELAKELNVEDRVHFLGFRIDIPSLMKSVDINILSSDYEGMSGVTLEALASKKPFLGSDVLGINDVVPDSRFLFEKGNAEQLAHKIQNIIDNPSFASQMSEDGFKFVKQYDIDIMVEKHLQLYQELIGKCK